MLAFPLQFFFNAVEAMTEEVKKVQDVAGEGEIIKLQTSDNEVFLVPKDVAFM